MLHPPAPALPVQVDMKYSIDFLPPCLAGFLLLPTELSVLSGELSPSSTPRTGTRPPTWRQPGTWEVLAPMSK